MPLDLESMVCWVTRKGFGNDDPVQTRAKQIAEQTPPTSEATTWAGSAMYCSGYSERRRYAVSYASA